MIHQIIKGISIMRGTRLWVFLSVWTSGGSGHPLDMLCSCKRRFRLSFMRPLRAHSFSSKLHVLEYVSPVGFRCPTATDRYGHVGDG